MLVQSNQKVVFLALLSVTLLFFSACATKVKTAKFTTSELRGKTAQTKILILKPHVAMHQMALGGVTELKADWTDESRRLANRSYFEGLEVCAQLKE